LPQAPELSPDNLTHLDNSDIVKTPKSAMNSKELQQLQKTVQTLVKPLSARNRDIISRRFGLSNGKRETLESIGTSYSITRERVRQIEEFTLTQLAKAVAEAKDVDKHISAITTVVAKEGGVMKEKDLFKAVSGNENYTTANAAISFLLTLSKDMVKLEENDHFHAFWAASKKDADGFKDAVASLVSAFEKQKSVVHANELKTFATGRSINSVNGEALAPKHLTAFMAVSKDLGKNIFEEVGLVSWSEIKPKGVRDKAYLIMKKEKAPRHFGEIARLINTAVFGDNKKVNIQTVHNELIKDQRFVLVGRGMYALSEWGYRSGTVKDVLVDILKNTSKPLNRTDLVARVMDARLVKENTILLNLQDGKLFAKKDDGTYELRKA
jgi:hypothetical protein